MIKPSPAFVAAMDASDAGCQTEAVKLMERCAMTGEPVACYFMALWYRDGDGVPVDAAESQRWMSELVRIAKSGNAEAQWELGQFLRFGNVFTCNVVSANYWLEQAANNGCGEAQHHLAWYLEAGQYGYAMNIETAERWYQRAFAQGHPETLYLYALREFTNGEITSKARALLERAADNGFQQALHVLSKHPPSAELVDSKQFI